MRAGAPIGQAVHVTSGADGVMTLGIDCGGSGIKGSVLDAEGEMVAERIRIKTPYPLPPERFVKTHWPGYFWDVEEKRLYSIKSGVLKPLVEQKRLYYKLGWRTVREDAPHYALSVCGARIKVRTEKLMKLADPGHDQYVEVMKYE